MRIRIQALFRSRLVFLSPFLQRDYPTHSWTFWCGSGCADPYLRLMDPDPDPAIFVIDLQNANKKLIEKKKFFCLLLFECTFTLFFKDKKFKRSRKTVRIEVFLTILLDDRRIHTSDWWIRIREAQNMWIRFRIQIRKTAHRPKYLFISCLCWTVLDHLGPDSYTYLLSLKSCGLWWKKKPTGCS